MSPALAGAVRAVLDKKAEDVVLLDLRGLSDVTDYFLICHGTSDRQVEAIADNIEERLRVDCQCRPSHIEGRKHAGWILMDYVDFVVHVFLTDKREFYRLERLWGDAPSIDLDAFGPDQASRQAQPRG